MPCESRLLNFYECAMTVPTREEDVYLIGVWPTSIVTMPITRMTAQSCPSSFDHRGYISVATSPWRTRRLSSLLTSLRRTLANATREAPQVYIINAGWFVGAAFESLIGLAWQRSHTPSPPRLRIHCYSFCRIFVRSIKAVEPS